MTRSKMPGTPEPTKSSLSILPQSRIRLQISPLSVCLSLFLPLSPSLLFSSPLSLSFFLHIWNNTKEALDSQYMPRVRKSPLFHPRFSQGFLVWIKLTSPLLSRGEGIGKQSKDFRVLFVGQQKKKRLWPPSCADFAHTQEHTGQGHYKGSDTQKTNPLMLGKKGSDSGSICGMRGHSTQLTDVQSAQSTKDDQEAGERGQREKRKVRKVYQARPPKPHQRTGICLELMGS